MMGGGYGRYDYLIVGAGITGATIARLLHDQGKKVLVIDKRKHIAGNCYTSQYEGIHVHRYGAHIFHTNSEAVWRFVNRFAKFNNFINSPMANYEGELYSLPFSMYTFNKMWGVTTPIEAMKKIKEQRESAEIETPTNLEEQAISLVGIDIYEKLIKGYTEKQWGRDCKDLPPSIIKRLPVRFTFDNNYFNAMYQGIPIGGYTKMIAKMLDGIAVTLNSDYLENRLYYSRRIAKKIIYTGPIDAYFEYCLGHLEYRSVEFVHELYERHNYQGNAVINYTSKDVPWTRIIEHKWFDYQKQPKTVITKEFSSEWKPGVEPYYPINDTKNTELYAKYKELAEHESNVIFCGRLGSYAYLDMDAAIEKAFEVVNNECK